MTGAVPRPNVGSPVDCDGSGGVELYIYYRVAAAHAAEVAELARECQRRACAAHPGLTARLLRRSEAADGGAQLTWMEVWRLSPDASTAHAPAGIDAALASAIEAHAQPLAAFIDGARHVERFAAVACA